MLTGENNGGAVLLREKQRAAARVAGGKFGAVQNRDPFPQQRVGQDDGPVSGCGGGRGLRRAGRVAVKLTNGLDRKAAKFDRGRRVGMAVKRLVLAMEKRGKSGPIQPAPH